MGVGSVAAAGALFDNLEIPRSSVKSHLDTKQWILIWGGSSVTGMYAIQLAKQAGLHVIAVAGLQNAVYLKELGVDLLLDRHQPEEAVSRIRSLGVSIGIDCVGKETSTYAVQSLADKGKLVCLVQKPSTPQDATKSVEICEVLVKRFHEDSIYGQGLMDFVSSLLFDKALRPVRHEVIKGGLHGIDVGLQDLQQERVSGKKLVVLLNDTAVN
jgi:NADPH:quinone reductase-like Zn-dependent oxidoreductase